MNLAKMVLAASLLVAAAAAATSSSSEQVKLLQRRKRQLGSVLSGVLSSLTGGGSSLKGDTGPTGPQGPAGTTGADSPAGAPGDSGASGDANGDSGAQGPIGATGAIGATGPSATGPNGAKGSTGPIGPTGAAGPIGATGDAGLDETQIIQGAKGAKGEPGATGPAGRSLLLPSKGEPGLDGRNGHVGSMGRPGRPGPVGPPGGPGECLRLDMDEVQDITEEEQRKLVFKVHRKLEQSLYGYAKEAVGRSCRELAKAKPQKPSGEYWIDPNGGDADDAILVHCDMEAKSTCIQPTHPTSEQVSYDATGELWFSNIPESEGGFVMTYQAGASQIKFLQWLSNRASQSITYHCSNSVAYFDARTGDHQQAVRLMSWNDLQLDHGGKFNYSVSLDECRHAKQTWAKTVFEMLDVKPWRLPIVDVAVNDAGSKKKMFGLEIGPVCYY